jgi:hypothetical protein
MLVLLDVNNLEQDEPSSDCVKVKVYNARHMTLRGNICINVSLVYLLERNTAGDKPHTEYKSLVNLVANERHKQYRSCPRQEISTTQTLSWRHTIDHANTIGRPFAGITCVETYSRVKYSKDSQEGRRDI